MKICDGDEWQPVGEERKTIEYQTHTHTHTYIYIYINIYQFLLQPKVMYRTPLANMLEKTTKIPYTATQNVLWTHSQLIFTSMQTNFDM